MSEQWAERQYADALGARDAIFTMCGSGSILLALLGPGRRLLVDRNAHRSVTAALIVAGAEPIWLRPCWDADRQIAHPPSVHEVEAALVRDPGVRAVLISTPTAYGAAANVADLAEACHRHGVPLLVDEAWGAHFGFHPGLPTAAVQAGADLVVQSLPPAEVLLFGTDLINPAALRSRLAQIGAAGPAAAPLPMAVYAERQLDAALDAADRLHARLAKVAGLAVLDEWVIGCEGVTEWDPLKLCVDVTGLGISGYQARDWLCRQDGFTVRLGDARRVVCSLAYARAEQVEHLGDVLERLAAEPPSADRPAPLAPSPDRLEQPLTPRAAFFAETELMIDPAGRISAETISPSPPGVPAILPGECFTPEIADYLRAGVAAGMAVPDASDPALGTFRVVRLAPNM